MSDSWYGWIPSLTREIPFKYFIDISKSKFEYDEITDEKRKKSLDKILSNSGVSYYTFYQKFEDPPDEESIVIVSVNNENKIDRVVISHKSPIFTIEEIDYWACCKIQDNGLLEINRGNINPNAIESDVINQIYIIVRDIYHEHTHHDCGDEHGDIFLEPVLVKNEKEAVEKINKRFQEKIVYYHGWINYSKKNLPIPKNLEAISTYIKNAKGEMTYAISFVDLFKDFFEENKENHTSSHDQYRSSYLNAISSIDILAKEIEIHYTSEINSLLLNLTKILTVFTLVLGLLTLLVAIDASFSIVEVLFHPEPEKEFNYYLVSLILLSGSIIIFMRFNKKIVEIISKIC